MREQEIIRRYFDFAAGRGVDVGIGDDAATLTPPPGAKLAVCTDTLNSGAHFFPDVAPYFLARKAAAVSLSDLAATGAAPLWMTVSLSSPPNPAAWFEEFARGLHTSAAEYDFSIVGGDLTAAAMLSVTTTAIGVLAGAPLLRGGAVCGDELWLSGRLGGAAHALGVLRGDLPAAAAAAEMSESRRALEDPRPRLALGRELVGVAHAAIDLSDGLLAAARTLADMSGVGAEIFVESLPAAESLSALSEEKKQACLLAGGDDYELLFAAPPAARPHIAALLALPALAEKTPLHRIGVFAKGEGVRLLLNGEEIPPPASGGYEHDFGE